LRSRLAGFGARSTKGKAAGGDPAPPRADRRCFAYEVTLPGDIDDTTVRANLDEGVLSLPLPKPEHERPRKIPLP